ANGIRTRVTAVRGRCPRPLDDSAEEQFVRMASFLTKPPAQLFSHGRRARASNGIQAPALPRTARDKQELGKFLKAQRFQKDKRDKLCSVNKVTAPEPAGLARQAEKPLQAMLAHPARSLRDSSAMEIKRGTNTNQNRGLEPVLVLGHPSFLFWRPQTYPNDIRASLVDQGHHFFVLFNRHRPVGRAVGARYLQTGEASG